MCWFTGIAIAYILISIFVNPRDEMYASIIGMPLGVLWAEYEEKIDAYFEVDFLKKEILTSIIFTALFVGRLILSAAGFENQFFQTILRNVITFTFIVPLIEGMKRVRIQKNSLRWLGTISYEIYIIHPFILYYFEKKLETGESVGNFEIIGWTIGCTLLLASILKKVKDLYCKKVRAQK